MKFRCSTHLRCAGTMALALAVNAGVSAARGADFIRWVGNDGLWGVDTNWNPVGLPGPLNPVLVDQGLFTATHDDPLATTIVAQILLENRMTVALNSGTLGALGGDTPEQYFTSLGVFGRSHYLQTGGMMLAPLGIDVSGQSLFEIANGTIVGDGDTAGINIAAASTYVQSGGENHLSLSIGGGIGTISGGSVGDTNASHVRVLFGGTLSQQGGIVTAHSVSVDTNGHFDVSAGTINATQAVNIGKLDAQGAAASAGTLTQTAGTMWVANALNVFSGTYTLGPDAMLQASGTIQVGTQAAAVPSAAVLEAGGTIVLNDTSTGIVGNGRLNFHGVLEKTGVSSTIAPIDAQFVVSGGTLDVQNGTITINSKVFALTPTSGDVLTKRGAGVLAMLGDHEWQPGADLRLLGGETIAVSDLGAGTARPSVRMSDATFSAGSTQSLATLEVGTASLVRIAPATLSTLIVGTLTIDADNGAALDLADNAMMLSSTPQTQVESLIHRARNGGTWDAAGITSSVAQTQAAPRIRTLAVLSGTEYLTLNGIDATFNHYAVNSADVLVKYTLYGDTDLNDVVNFDDYARTDAGFNNGLTGWLNGDFDFNGQVNFDDYALIDLAFNAQSETLLRAVSFLNGEKRSSSGMDRAALRLVAQHYAQFGEGYAQTFLNAVPEPAGAFAVVTCGSALFLRNLRRRRQVTPG